ncbi:Uncharacterised protein [Chlamydia trachomatis]|nr:Uncharacterised protein [Chlamydia trachomatis]
MASKVKCDASPGRAVVTVGSAANEERSFARILRAVDSVAPESTSGAGAGVPAVFLELFSLV